MWLGFIELRLDMFYFVFFWVRFLMLFFFSKRLENVLFLYEKIKDFFFKDENFLNVFDKVEKRS